MKNKKTKKKANLPANPEPNVIEVTTVATTSKVIEVAAVVTIPDPVRLLK